MFDHQSNEKPAIASTGSMSPITLKTRPLRRLLLVICSLATLLLLPILFEPRQRSLNCRNFWSCLNPFSHRPAYHTTTSTLDEDLHASVTEATLSDGAVRFNRKLGTGYQPVLFLVVVDAHGGTSSSWSRDYQSTRRSIYDFLDLIAGTGLDPQDIALGVLLLTETAPKSDSSLGGDEFELMKAATDQIPLGRVTILQKNETVGRGGGEDDGASASDDARRSRMARSRNYLMQRALNDERHVVWFDANVAALSPGVIQAMIQHAQSRPDVGIITARVENDETDSRNERMWAITNESSPLASSPFRSDTTDDAQELDKFMIAELARSKTAVSDLISGTVNSDLVPLDSVGGSVLYIRSDLIRHGLVFPWWKAVGTTWSHDGWFGLEAEGLCYLSRRIEGGGCFVLGGTHKIRHTDW